MFSKNERKLCIDPDRFLQKSVLGRRCISPCLKPDNDAKVPKPKFHYCFTSPWMMKFNKNSTEYFPEDQMFDWDMCSHRHCEGKKCSNPNLFRHYVFQSNIFFCIFKCTIQLMDFNAKARAKRPQNQKRHQKYPETILTIAQLTKILNQL